MITTERTTAMIPKDMLAEARETWPELRDMPSSRIMRFALAYALTNGDVKRAILATRDPRTGTKRNKANDLTE